jgi:hypothetical protein
MPSIELTDESERLVAEQALLAFRASRRAASMAPEGSGLEVAERAVLEEGRKTMRLMLERVLEGQAHVGKGGSTPWRARAAAPAGPGSRRSPR